MTAYFTVEFLNGAAGNGYVFYGVLNNTAGREPMLFSSARPEILLASGSYVLPKLFIDFPCRFKSDI